MYEVGSKVLITDVSSLGSISGRKIRTILSVTKAGNFKTRDCIISKTNRVLGSYGTLKAEPISKGEAIRLKDEWAKQHELATLRKSIEAFDWSRLKSEDLTTVGILIGLVPSK